MVIPYDWKEARLGDLGSTYGGLSGKSAQDFRSGDASYVTFMNVMGNVVLRPSGTGQVNVRSGEVQSRLQVGDVIFNGSSETPEEVGFGAAVPAELEGAYLNSFCFGFRCHQGTDLDAKFLAYLTRSPAGRAVIRPMAQGSTRYNLAKTNLLNGRFLLPPLKEQEAIAEALGDADAAIEALDALIAKKRDVKQAAMQQLLTGRTRLQGFSDEWSRRRLGDFCRVVMGQSPVSEFYNTDGNGLPLIQGNADIKNRKTIERVWSVHAPKLARPGDVLLTVRAPVGAAARASAQVCLGRGVCALQPSDAAAGFLFHALVFGEPRWAALEQGSTFTAANARDVAEFLIDIPPSISEQEVIAQVLSDMDDEIEALVAQRDKMRLVKQGMMQELLSGRVRLV